MPISTKKEAKSWLKNRNKFMSGYCSNGFCEGTKPRSFRGTPQKTCHLIDECPCECHRQLDLMFESTGVPRQLVTNPEYTPERVDFNIEDYLQTPSSDAPSTDGGVDGPDIIEGTPMTPAVAALAQRRTETGRAARGGLEAQVLEACHALAILDQHITPKMISGWIAGKYEIPEPSTGAIGAVFNRWEKLGFAKQEKKPVRFAGFTGDGTALELERLKGKVKRESRRTQSALRRGIRP